MSKKIKKLKIILLASIKVKNFFYSKKKIYRLLNTMEFLFFNFFRLNNSSNFFFFDFFTLYVYSNFRYHENCLKLWNFKKNNYFFLDFNLKYRQIKYLCRDLSGETYTSFTSGIILKDFLVIKDYKQYRKGIYGSRIFWEKFKDYIKYSGLKNKILIIGIKGLTQTFLRFLKNITKRSLKLRIIHIIHQHCLPYNKRMGFKKGIFIKRRVKKRIISKLNSTKYFSHKT